MPGECPSSHTSQSAKLLDQREWEQAVSRIIAAAETLGKAIEPDVRKLIELRERSASGRFHMAVLGQFKRGKSSLLNALLGEPLLPSGIAPVTAIPTLITAGAGYEVLVRYAQGTFDSLAASNVEEACGLLRKFVSEEGNPGNRLGVARVEATSPSPLLAHGVVLIDTPGIGSTFRHNSLATLAFLPECDAALFVVSADPPITEVEVTFLNEVLKMVSRVFFVMNKADYLNAEERIEAVAFLRRALAHEAHVDAATPVFLVSARDGARSQAETDKSPMAESGIAGLRQHVTRFLAREKNQALREALSCKVSDTARDVSLRISLMIQSVSLPLRELESRLEMFNTYVRDAERERQVIRDGIAGDQRRVLEFFEEYCRQLRGSAAETFSNRAQTLLCQAAGPRDVTGTIGAMFPDFFAKEMGEATRAVEQRIQEAIHGHAERAAALRDGIREAAARIFEIPHHARRSATTLELRREPFWITRPWDAVMSPLPDSFVDAMLPGAIRARRIRARVAVKVDELVTRNVENLRWAILQSIKDSLARIAAELDGEMEGEVRAIRIAIDLALEKKNGFKEAVVDEIRRLERVQAALTEELERFERGRAPVPGRVLS